MDRTTRHAFIALFAVALLPTRAAALPYEPPWETVPGTSALRAMEHLVIPLEDDDDEGDVLTYTWTEGPSTLALTSDPVQEVTVGLPVGTHTLTLTVTDRYGISATDEVTIEVTDAIGGLDDDLQQCLVDQDALDSQLTTANTTINSLQGQLTNANATINSLQGQLGCAAPGPVVGPCATNVRSSLHPVRGAAPPAS